MTCPSACAKPLIDPRKLRHRIAIQAVTETPDGKGAFTSGWATVAEAWAAIEPYGGYERWRSEKIEAPVSHKVTIRFQPGITAKHRVLFGARVFEIVGEPINPEERGVALVLRCLEGVSDA